MREKPLGPLMVDVAGLELVTDDREILSHPLVGGAILFTRNFAAREQLSGLVRQLREVRPDLLVAVDYEGGRVQRFRQEFTPLPPMRRLGQQYDADPSQALELASHIGWLIGAELRAADVDLSLAPVLDLDGGVSAVIGDRSFHATVDGVSDLAGALMEGLKATGMAATGKHYPGHGQVVEDSHAALPVDRRSYAEVRAQDIEPFARLIARGLPSVMMAHIRFPAVDSLPASLSPRWIQQHLREELGFGGAVFCDDLSMHGAAVVGGYVERAEAALAAGCDMLPVCNNRAAVVELLDQLRVPPSVAGAARLQKLQGQPAVAGFDGLPKHARWQQAQAALRTLV
ncbi:MAG: beta-N-acetylhexosaminidase [Nevskiales bacterium]